MTRKISLALVLTSLLATLLSGCAIEPKRVEAPPETRFIVQPATPSETDQLLNYAARIRKSDAREFAAEREMSRAQFQREKSDFNRIKYALTLMLPPTPVATATATAQDDAELALLVEPLAMGVVPTPAATQAGAQAGTESNAAELRALAAVLFIAASDRKKMREQLRDSQARLNLAKKDETRDAEARALRLRIEELEGKLNALKSIDRSVNRRAEPPQK